MSNYEIVETPEGSMVAVKFEGHFDSVKCTMLCRKLSDFITEQNDKIVFLWDCQAMTGFDQEARKVWTEFLKERRDQIAKVVVVSDNVVIRGAARLILKFLGLNSDVIRGMHELNTVSWVGVEVAG